MASGYDGNLPVFAGNRIADMTEANGALRITQPRFNWERGIEN